MRRLAAFALLALFAACDDPAGPGERDRPDAAVSLVAGDVHTCALTERGEAYCWGASDVGQLGTGTNVGSTSPVAVTGGLRFTALAAAGKTTCGLTREGAAYCWGLNTDAQLGNGTTTDAAVPQPVSGRLVFASVGVGGSHACGSTRSGEAYCWGSNATGRLGTGSTTSSPVPVPVAGGLAFRSLSPGLLHTCAITTAGATYCWGSNALGQRGVGSGVTPANATSPVAVPGTAFGSVSAGGAHTCALASGAAYCWGYNLYGQVGNGAGGGLVFTPAAVAGGLRFTAVYPGRANSVVGFSCGIAEGGAAHCWGSSDAGQLGTTQALESCRLSQQTEFGCARAPVPVAGGLAFRTLALGRQHACGLTTGGEVWCWGSNASGQLGNASNADSPVPVKVAGTLRFPSS
ncbi:MAG TPA: hypothetical protein VF263_17040 [Longimicrobiaceae bacterium]